MAEPSTGPSQIVWCQLRHAGALGRFLHNVPNRLHRHAISPCPSDFVDPAEQLSSINCSCGEPMVQFGSHPIGNWNRSNVASLTDQVNNGNALRAAGDDPISTPRLHAASSRTREAMRAMRGRVFLSIDDGQVLAKVLGPAPQSANCRGALPISLRL
jgi:hypothetical protein